MKLLVFLVRNRLEGKSILIPRIRKEFTSHSAPSEKNGALESPVSSSQTERKRECGYQVSPAARSMSKCPRFTYMLHAGSRTTQRKRSRQPGTQKVSICNWKQTKLVLGEMFPGKSRCWHNAVMCTGSTGLHQSSEKRCEHRGDGLYCMIPAVA
jgi:hypothetical protein